MKFHLVPCLLFFAAPLFLSAQEDFSLLKARLDLLEAKRDISLKEMAKLRQEFIRKDPSLRKIHERIIQEHRKLALLLDTKKEIHQMNDQMLKLDAEIREVKAKMDKAGKGKVK